MGGCFEVRIVPSIPSGIQDRVSNNSGFVWNGDSYLVGISERGFSEVGRCEVREQGEENVVAVAGCRSGLKEIIYGSVNGIPKAWFVRNDDVIIQINKCPDLPFLSCAYEASRKKDIIGDINEAFIKGGSLGNLLEQLDMTGDKQLLVAAELYLSEFHSRDGGRRLEIARKLYQHDQQTGLSAYRAMVEDDFNGRDYAVGSRTRHSYSLHKGDVVLGDLIAMGMPAFGILALYARKMLLDRGSGEYQHSSKFYSSEWVDQDSEGIKDNTHRAQSLSRYTVPFYSDAEILFKHLYNLDKSGTMSLMIDLYHRSGEQGQRTLEKISLKIIKEERSLLNFLFGDAIRLVEQMSKEVANIIFQKKDLSPSKDREEYATLIQQVNWYCMAILGLIWQEDDNYFYYYEVRKMLEEVRELLEPGREGSENLLSAVSSKMAQIPVLISRRSAELQEEPSKVELEQKE